MNNDIPEKDKKDWQDFISGDEKLPNKDYKKLSQRSYKIKTIDLHGYSLEQANKTIEDFIYQAYKEKANKLIVVTGKGLHSKNEIDPYVSKKLGILKYSVPEFINKNIDLMKIIHEIKEATVEDGGDGAFYIFLKKNKSIK